MHAYTCLDGSERCVCWCACASLILWAKVWNEKQRHIADGKVREAFKLPTVGLSSRGSLHLFTPAARLLLHVPLFFSICLSVSPFWNVSSSSWYPPPVLPSQAFCLLFYSFMHLSFSTFSSRSFYHSLRTSDFPLLPGLFTMSPVCMTDKYHITLSIWIHFGRILYTRPFTHFHTLNTIETCVCVCTVQI